MIAYVENPNESEKKKKTLLDLINSYIARYKVNVQKSITSLYTSNEQVGFEI